MHSMTQFLRDTGFSAQEMWCTVKALSEEAEVATGTGLRGKRPIWDLKERDNLQSFWCKDCELSFFIILLFIHFHYVFICFKQQHTFIIF